MTAMPVTTERIYSVEEYLALDRASEIPHEYLQGPAAVLDLPSIGCTLSLAEVYEKVPLTKS